MPRRYDHSQEEIIKMICDSGHQMIKESGFANFSTRKIARSIGYTIGTLYYTCKSYDNIMFHINSKTLDNMSKYVKKNIGDSHKSLDQSNEYIKNIAYSYIEFASKNYNNWSALFEFRPKETPPEFYAAKVNNLFSIITNPLKEVIKDEKQIEDSVKILWASIHGICILNLGDKLGLEQNNEEQRLQYAKSLASNLIDNFIFGLQNQ